MILGFFWRIMDHAEQKGTKYGAAIQKGYECDSSYLWDKYLVLETKTKQNMF